MPEVTSRNPILSDMNQDYYPGGNFAPSNQWDLFKWLSQDYPAFQDNTPVDPSLFRTRDDYLNFLQHLQDIEDNEVSKQWKDVRNKPIWM